MPQIQQTYEIEAPIEEVWDALTNPETMQAWGAGDAVVMKAVVGGKFSLWDGDIYGTNILVQMPNKLIQNWYGGAWPEPSKVEFNLIYKDGITTVTLLHAGLPEAEVDRFAQGWKDYYLGPIKDLLENSIV